MTAWPSIHRRVLTAAVACLSLAGGAARPTQPPADQPFVLTLPAELDMSGVHIRYFMSGAFGGYGGFVLVKPGVHEYALETAREDQPALSFQVFIYVPGHEFEALDLSGQLTDPNRRVRVVPRRLPTIPLFGRISSWPTHKHGKTAVAGYYAWWQCEFFGLPDCALGPMEVARANIDSSGRFSMDLPDFARDSTIARFRNPGEFVLDIRDRASGNVSLTLHHESDQRGLPVSRAYPGELVFHVRAQR